ncbi:glycosyltransferase [Capillimicrobium parvum]|uniref:glycosyltransferase n=1 Tax=Capillimicrobium parvum TaxID=2884022 RepID=UPI00216B5DB7|nr:glycosyltransferase [Capillimicrobium parvum]
MRVLIFHGYLLRGTGSNVYTSKLAEALRHLGHEVHVLCQDRDPRDLPWVDAIGTWAGSGWEVEVLREPVRATIYRPDIGTLLPVYVADRYEGFDARPFPACSDAEIAEYVARNVEAVRAVAERARPDVSLANHLVMGPAILARAGLRTAVKIHGSALEYVVKPHPERFMPWAREGLSAARTILVGSLHTGQSLWDALGAELQERTRLGPPGVDIEQFAPRAPQAAARELQALAEALAAGAGGHLDEAGEAAQEAGGADAFAMDHAAAGRALQRLDLGRDRLVAYTGKLIVSKGVDLLLAAWPLVLDAAPDARLVVVGFGAYRDGLMALQRALAAGDLEGARDIARAGRALEGGPRAPLHHLLTFLDSEAAAGEAYRRAAARLDDRVVWCGRLEHAELAHVLPACEAQVVPSTFPEAFGMVAAEAAACGALPISAAHSGLAEVTRTLAAAVGDEFAPLLSFGVGPRAVDDLADRITGWLRVCGDGRDRTRAALVATARERFSWDGVAAGVVAAGLGRLDELPLPS